MRWICLVLLVSVAGCSGDGLPDFFKLDRLRVLALLIDQPEVDPGTVVTITPVVSDLLGEGRALTYSAATCLDPGVGFGATPTCEDSETRVELAAEGTAVTGVSAPNYTGSVTSTLTVAVPSSEIIFAGRTDEEQFNGVSYLVTYTLKAGSDEVQSFRRVIVSTKTTKNQNPTFTAGSEIQVNGASLVSLPTGAVTLVAGLDSGIAEDYEEKDSDGISATKTERPLVTWLVSDGDVTRTRTETDSDTTLNPPAEAPSGRNFVLIAVLRDGRGGVSFVQKNL